MTPRDIVRHALLAVFALICLGALTWPGYGWLGNRVEPTFFGLPFVLVWNIIWVFGSFSTLAAFHVTGRDEGR